MIQKYFEDESGNVRMLGTNEEPGVEALTWKDALASLKPLQRPDQWWRLPMVSEALMAVGPDGPGRVIWTRESDPEVRGNAKVILADGQVDTLPKTEKACVLPVFLK